MDTDEPSVPLPSAAAIEIGPRIRLQPPLSRRGHGPGLIIAMPGDLARNEGQVTLDPPPRQKWAEEGYAVVEIQLSAERDAPFLKDAIKTGVDRLIALAACDVKDRFGLILYNSSILRPDEVSDLNSSLQFLPITAIVIYGAPISFKIPRLVQLPLSCKNEQQTPAAEANVKIHEYAEANSSYFVIPNHKDFLPSSAAVAHTRSLTFLKSKLGGPNFDLEAIWDEHTFFEFEDRSVAKTMGTMVQEPYVNHVPTMTGGIGRDRLSNFYRYHFIWNNPKDTKLELTSRTVGVDRVIDEFIFCFTHDEQIDWLAPGIPPTGQPVRLPMVSVVNVRGDRLYHEHIWWDQACLLRQLGLLPEYLPFPYPLPDGRRPADGKRFEYRVPATGAEAARKLVDENSVESNEMFAFEVREVEDR
ncbi:nuclear transport factor 2 family protein [Emydomyces testavorans]|uniref:Nuclear transport factor 2 family protein n=1 Tax=Emydomyces testavorans TaxID=2070801 RepID=A0AAF0DL33_9EURO|nr:nuclear transport factor 2 family protein [Emydomyces testavorans]